MRDSQAVGAGGQTCAGVTDHPRRTEPHRRDSQRGQVPQQGQSIAECCLRLPAGADSEYVGNVDDDSRGSPDDDLGIGAELGT